MVLRVLKIEGELYVALTAEAIERFGLHEGQAVEIKVESASVEQAAKPEREIRYATVAETLEAFRHTEPLHRNTYRELAK